MPVFLKLAKGLSNRAQVFYDSFIFPRKRKLLRVHNSVGGCVHNAVLIRSSQRCPQGSIPPIGRRLRDQKMECSVVRGRDSAPQSNLGRWDSVDEFQRLAEEVVVVRHLLPVGIFPAILFGLGPVVEVSTQAPIF